MTNRERRQMTGEEYVRRLQDGAHEENWKGAEGLSEGGGSLFAGIFAVERDDSARAYKWRNYERLIDRFYGAAGLVTVSEDGARTPWSPARLGDGA
ncbi:MAG TPA: hypothetical protein VNM48_08265 [Chloroflexota bacterium]|nr:hypothetical protein [Chloroflexota bacterium]